MDVDRLFDHVEAKNADKQRRLTYILQIGMRASALENLLPEKLLADQSKPVEDSSQPQGVSAVKAIAIASSQGQKIYTLNQTNQSIHETILANLQMAAEGKQEISNALAIGKEVTLHLNKITVSGWQGSGYIILDPDTGAGAYKIGGGANGGEIFLGSTAAGALAKIALTGYVVGLITGVAMISITLVAITLIYASLLYYLANFYDERPTDGRYATSEAIIQVAEVLPHFATRYGPLTFVIQTVLTYK